MNWLARLKNLECIPAPTLQKLRNREQGVSVVFVGACPEPIQNSMPESEVMTARLALFTDRGLSMKEAEVMAERLTLRDLEPDDRRLCLECQQLSGGESDWRCSQWRKTGSNSPELPSDLVTTVLHRCAGFNDRLKEIK
jgi:hypothetical protein